MTNSFSYLESCCRRYVTSVDPTIPYDELLSFCTSYIQDHDDLNDSFECLSGNFNTIAEKYKPVPSVPLPTVITPPAPTFSITPPAPACVPTPILTGVKADIERLVRLYGFHKTYAEVVADYRRIPSLSAYADDDKKVLWYLPVYYDAIRGGYY